MQKRDCPIKIEISDVSDGALKMRMTVDGDVSDYTIHGYNGDCIAMLLQHIYYMYPGTYNPYLDCEIVETKTVYETSDDGTVAELNIPYKTEFRWLEENTYCEWKLSRNATLATEFDLDMSITKSDEDNETEKKYTVSYKEFCYALAKAYTEILKKCGINGFHEAYWGEDVNFRQLLFIKAIALDCDEMIQTEFDENEGAYSDINKEIEVLMFDM